MGILRAALALLLFIAALHFLMPATSAAVQLNMISKPIEGGLFLLLFFAPFFVLGHSMRLTGKYPLTGLLSGFLLSLLVIYEMPLLFTRRIHRVQFPRPLTEFEKDQLQKRSGFPLIIETMQGAGARVTWVSEISFRKNPLHQGKLEEELQSLAEKDKKLKVSAENTAAGEAGAPEEENPPPSAATSVTTTTGKAAAGRRAGPS